MKINLLIITLAVMLLESPVAKSAEAYPTVGPYRSVGSDVNQANQLPGTDMYRNKASQQRNYPMRPVRPQVQMNQVQGNFPQVRGPVYGPNIPPAERYNYPNQAMQRPMNQYPPAWR